MQKYGEWEDRSSWDSDQWREWWADRTARRNYLKAKDLEEIPLLRIELRRAIRVFSYATMPKQSKRYGVINPFLGAQVMLPELTMPLENGTI